MCKCKIQWVDSKGEFTPDDNDAVGYAISFSGIEGNNCFPICAAHLERMPRQGWMFLRLSEATADKLAARLAEIKVVVEAIQSAFDTAPQILPTLRASGDHYSFVRWGMYVGIEPDGYIHT